MSTGSDLRVEEQQRVRVALRYLRVRFGGWASLTKALKFKGSTLGNVANAHKQVSASMAVRVARLVNVGVDQLLAGAFPPAGSCPLCGHGPDPS